MSYTDKMTIDNTGSIAITILQNLPQISAGVSGNLIYIVDGARQYVSNFIGVSINPTNIPTAYQGAILDFSMADTIDLINAQPGGESLSLGELSLDEKEDALTAQQYRLMGEQKLKAIGIRATMVRRRATMVRSLS